ncbi:hypothetical protein E5672_18830 [Alteromonas portus]|uniref:Uncharacterized protein n=1 Tax=Alteromonas portus TaxID=2565549 RepID=A0A4U0Z7Y3_9ALTE|nr:hypothetical protein [Alteromonas portus]TKB00724.1 hypothetical protein E5672_18830 [Alteromonas portus]
MNSRKDEIKEELGINLAKSILDASLSTRDNLVKTLSSISVVSIPAYIGALKVFPTSIESFEVGLKLLPVLCWALALSICFVILFLKAVVFDFKNIQVIIETHYDVAKKAKTKALFAVGLHIAGLVLASYIFL